MNILLIGGIRDGERLEIEDGIQKLRVAITPKIQLPMRAEEYVQPGDPAPARVEVYNRAILDDCGKRSCVFVSENLPECQLIETMIAGYKEKDQNAPPSMDHIFPILVKAREKILNTRFIQVLTGDDDDLIDQIEAILKQIKDHAKKSPS